MNWKEAFDASEGQLYARPVTLKPLNQPKPDPDQDTVILCSAPVKPQINTGSMTTLPDNRVRVHISYIAGGEPCVMGTQPNCSSCNIFDAAQELQDGTIILSKEELKNLID